MDAIERAGAELADLIAEHRREPLGNDLVQRESNAAGLLFKTTETPLPAAAEPVSAPSISEEAIGAGIAEAVAYAMNQMRQERADEVDAIAREAGVVHERIDKLQAENRELKGMLGDVLARLEQQKGVTDKLESDRTGLK